jgi:quercetin dioxygenase-like cupin family protein
MMKQIVKAEGEGEQRWFLGGGVLTWKVAAEEANGAFFVAEDNLVKGKTTPLHSHPNEDELVYVIDGEILLYNPDGEPRRVGRGSVVMNPRGIPHAFTVVSETARLLFIQTPGTAEAFYRGASVAMPESGEGPVDFKKLGEVAKATGVTEILGPPPFRR